MNKTNHTAKLIGVFAWPGRLSVRLLLITFFIASFGSSCFASHLVGGEITYSHNTGLTYRIKLILYRDCAGIPLQNTEVVRIRSVIAGAMNQNVTLTRTSIADRTILCPGQVSRCSVTNGVPGVEAHTYEANVSLPNNTSRDYVIEYGVCCRPTGITTLSNSSNQNLYLSTTLRHDAASINNSPAFLNPPLGKFCVGQLASLSPNGFDIDGDALVYSLVGARQGNTGAPQPVVYASGFSGTQPLSSSTPITINPSTGIINFTPLVQNQRAVIAIRAEEYRNGVKIGEIFRDVEVTTTNCAGNATPSIAPIANAIVQVGQNFCTNISASDPNPTQTITLSANSGIIPPGTFTTTASGPGFANAQFCFTPTPAHAGNTFSVTVNAIDNNCPSPATATRTFNITVPAPCNVTVAASGTNTTCGLNDGTATASLTGGVPPYSYDWTGPNGYTASSQNISGLAPGTYDVTIVDGNSCVGTAQAVVGSNGGGVSFTAIVQQAQCGMINGSITATGSGGTPPYSYSIGGGTPQAGGSFTGLAPGTYDITVKDNLGCPSTQTFSIIAQADAIAPDVKCKSYTAILDANGNVNITPGDIDDGTTDNCNQFTLSISKSTFNCADVGPNQVTLTATDASNNVSSCVATVTVVDQTGPNLHCMDATIYLSASGVAPVGVADVFDHDHETCPIISMWVTPTSFTCQNRGPNVVTLSATDASNNIGTCTATVTVVDNLAPVPAVASLPDVLAECSATLTAPLANDNCAGQVTGTTSDPITYSAQGTYTVTWQYADGNGNSVSQMQTVIINDITVPVANVATLPVITGECSATVTAPTATDNCSGTITGTTTNQTTYTAQGSYTITWTYDDGNGNSSTQSQTVIVDDITAPVPDVATLPVVTGECSATVTAPTATDNCSGTITGTTTDPTTYTAQGTYTVHWSYNDGNGNISSQNQTVIIDDVTAPIANVVTLPVVTGECSATVTAPTATDNCVGPVTGTTTNQTTYTAQGTYTITWTYDDGNGNSSTQSQTVIVDDITAPVPDVATLPVVTGECSATVTAPTATDNCSGTITGTTTDPMTYTAQGTYTVHWSYNDGNGNISGQNQTVVVNDVTPPVVSCKSYTLTLVNGSGTITPADVDNGSSDNCQLNLSVSPSAFTCANAGDNTVTLTAADNNNNVSTCTAIVKVQYQPACALTVTPSNTTYTGGVPTNIYLGYGPQSATISSNVTGGAGFMYSWSPAAGLNSINGPSTVFTPTAAGNYTYTLTVTNGNGCATTCTVTFCVKDVREYKKGSPSGKVNLCHMPPGNPANAHTLSVSTNAVGSHLGNHTGDHLGACGDICGVSMKYMAQHEHADDEMEIQVFPNPFTNQFTLRIESTQFDEADVTIYDITGRIADQKTKQPTNSSIVLGRDLSNGIYIVEVRNGTTMKKVKLVKQ